MTPKEQAAMQQALGALVRAEAMYGQPNADIQTALRSALADSAAFSSEALAEQAEQSQLADASLEPVAYAPIITFLDAQHYSVSKQKKPEYCNPLYAAPVRTKDLTDKQIEKVWSKNGGYMGMPIDFARAVIKEFRRKNDLI